LPPTLAAAHAQYVAALAKAPLSDESRRTYASKVRQFLAWLDTADVDGEPLADPAPRDWAVRDYRIHLAPGGAASGCGEGRAGGLRAPNSLSAAAGASRRWRRRG
jgi:integrase/recombinase XerC